MSSNEQRLAVSSATCANCGGQLVRSGVFEEHTVEQCLRHLRGEVARLDYGKKDRKVWHGF